jgi:hypothetical protein
MVSLGKEYNQIVNLTKFNVNVAGSPGNTLNFSRFIHNNDILSHSPDYIIEKYNHWIGFKPTAEYEMYTPDNMTNFFIDYWKRWRVYKDKYEKEVRNILMYLYSTQNMNLLVMSDSFEKYIGPMSMISDVQDKKGLHHLTERFVDEVLEKNIDNLKVVLRDMKIGSII